MDDRERRELFDRLYSSIGVAPVNYGFGWIASGNPSTITFEEAMLEIADRVNTLKNPKKEIILKGALSDL